MYFGSGAVYQLGVELVQPHQLGEDIRFTGLLKLRGGIETARNIDWRLRQREFRKNRPQRMLPGDQTFVEEIHNSQEGCLQHDFGRANQIRVRGRIVYDPVREHVHLNITDPIGVLLDHPRDEAADCFLSS